MANEEDNGYEKNDANTSGRKSVNHQQQQKQQQQRQQSNGSISGFIDENNSGAEGSASDDCGDKMATESDPLQPKMLKSRSAHKIKEVKEVRDFTFKIIDFRIVTNEHFIKAVNSRFDTSRTRA